MLCLNLISLSYRTKYNDMLTEDEARVFSDDEEEERYQATEEDEKNGFLNVVHRRKCFSIFNNNRYYEMNILFYRFSLFLDPRRFNLEVNPWIARSHYFHNQDRQGNPNGNSTQNPVPNFEPQFHNLSHEQSPLFPFNTHPRFGYGPMYNAPYTLNNMFGVHNRRMDFQFLSTMLPHCRIPYNNFARFNVPFNPINNPNFPRFPNMSMPPYPYPSTSMNMNTGGSTSTPPTSLSSTINTTTNTSIDKTNVN